MFLQPIERNVSRTFYVPGPEFFGCANVYNNSTVPNQLPKIRFLTKEKLQDPHSDFYIFYLKLRRWLNESTCSKKAAFLQRFVPAFYINNLIVTS